MVVGGCILVWVEIYKYNLIFFYLLFLFWLIVIFVMFLRLMLVKKKVVMILGVVWCFVMVFENGKKKKCVVGERR